MIRAVFFVVLVAAALAPGRVLADVGGDGVAGGVGDFAGDFEDYGADPVAADPVAADPIAGVGDLGDDVAVPPDDVVFTDAPVLPGGGAPGMAPGGDPGMPIGGVADPALAPGGVDPGPLGGAEGPAGGVILPGGEVAPAPVDDIVAASPEAAATDGAVTDLFDDEAPAPESAAMGVSAAAAILVVATLMSLTM